MPTSHEATSLWALVMAGGSGTRFWPMSRRARPKQLLPFGKGTSLLAATVERLAGLVQPAHVLVITGREVESGVREELPGVPPGNLLVEPVGRDTAAAIGWAAWRLARAHPDAIMIVLPADHVVSDAAALRSALAAAAAAAFARGGLVTLGVRPTRAETGFGYLELGEEVTGPGGLRLMRVVRFVEKPERERAEAMVAAGNFRWNAGMFAWTVKSIEAAIRRHLPELAGGLDAIMDDALRHGEAAAVAGGFGDLPKVSIDYGIMERAGDVWCVPVDFEWFDIGSWTGLAEVLPAAVGGTALGDVVAVDSDECVLISDGPLVAALGVRGLVVVATRDAVLVVPKDQAQRVKELVERLQAEGRCDLL
jgi:mannose-1-phosphate guanylyltransferase